MNSEFAVIGAGIAGLAAATELAESGHDVVVLEAAGRVGGTAESVRRDGLLFERGPSTVRATPDLERLAALGGVELVRAERAAPYLCTDGKLVRLPPSLGDLLHGRPLPARALLGLLGEPFRARYQSGAHSVGEVVAARCGAGVAERVADALTLGIYGAPASEVGFEAAFPALAKDLARHGSFARLALARLLSRKDAQPRGALVSTRDGIEALPRALAARLGARVQLGRAVRSVAPGDGGFELRCDDGTLRASAVIVAVPPASARAFLREPETSRLLPEFGSVPQALAIFALDERALVTRWPGFGFLVPAREGLPILGALFFSQLFPDRAPPGTLAIVTFLGPSLRDEAGARIEAQIGPLLKRLLGSARVPPLVEVARHPLGIPLYDRAHVQRVRALRDQLDRWGRLAVAGAGYDGVAFGAAAASGIAAARALGAPAPRSSGASHPQAGHPR